ncbi:hypothetical protein LCI18_006309 [Fusarium solani-melongenae]|uniref:Uncharacterized protein n=1 Tax=Fusarium solani subsp. cucurbitae TaxID=2747967 RepID=A0ACD3Z294_FUSSC|nr:hypothetical protein LCI18_006309 [Fusarium solani-melongenae]
MTTTTSSTASTASGASIGATASQVQQQQFVSRQRPIARYQSQHDVPRPSFTTNPPQIESFPRGYPSLSALLSSDPDFTIFRCFARLHTRVLLHKQDDLIELEQKLDQLDLSQSQANPYLLTTNRRREANKDRQELLGKIEEKLKEYDALLAAFYTHLERSEPEESEIQSVANWMDGKKPVAFAESTFLNDWSDLRRAKHSVEKGGLETFLGRCAGVSSLCKDTNPKSEDPQIQFIKQSKVIAVSRTLTTIFAVATLVVPIGILYAVKAVPARLWVITAFTGVFSSALCWLTSSRNYEIFSATAAYCAVMVVFVGSLPNE